MKVFYFTATGNSLEVAKFLGGECISIPKVMKGNDRYFEDEVIGFVFPCYVSNMPTLVENFMKEAEFKADYIFAIMTYGNMHLGARGFTVDLGQKYHIKIDYSNHIKMVDTSLKYYDMEKQIEDLPKKDVAGQLNKLKQDIENRLHYKGRDNIITKNISKLGYRAYRKEIGDCDRLFTVEDHCTKCGVCVKVCPVDNIDLKDTVAFKGNCIRCYACTQNCPVNAIRFEGEKNKSRYRNAQVTLKEIIDANN